MNINIGELDRTEFVTAPADTMFVQAVFPKLTPDVRQGRMQRIGRFERCWINCGVDAAGSSPDTMAPMSPSALVRSGRITPAMNSSGLAFLPTA